MVLHGFSYTGLMLLDGLLCCRALAAEALQPSLAEQQEQGTPTLDAPLANITIAVQQPRLQRPPKPRGGAAEDAAVAAQEAGCVLRSSSSSSSRVQAADASGGWEQELHAELQAIAEEEAGCIVRSSAVAAAPRRMTRASAARSKATGDAKPGSQNDARAANIAEKAMPPDAPSSKRSTGGRRRGEAAQAPEEDAGAKVSAALSAMSLGCSEGGAESTDRAPPAAATEAGAGADIVPCTPAPTSRGMPGHGRAVAAASRMATAAAAAPVTPVLGTTARKASRFAGMQTGCLQAAPATEAPDQAARRRPPKAFPRTALPPARKRSAAAEPSARSHGPAQQREGPRRATTCSKAASADTAATPFVLRRKPADASLDAPADPVANLGARMRGLALGSSQAGLGRGDGGAEADGRAQRGPVLLVLCGRLQSLPWESLPRLQRQRCRCDFAQLGTFIDGC